MASRTPCVTWFNSISASGGVPTIAAVYDVACAAACSARFCACSDVVRNQMTMGMVACTARSLADPDHALLSEVRLAASSSACVSNRIASASHPAAACNIGAAPAPNISREVLISGGMACHDIVGIAGIRDMICWIRVLVH